MAHAWAVDRLEQKIDCVYGSNQTGLGLTSMHVKYPLPPPLSSRVLHPLDAKALLETLKPSQDERPRNEPCH